MKLNRKGFTLIELVIVIIVIGILAAVAIPRFADLAGHARSASQQATVVAVRQAINIYRAENELRPGGITATNPRFPARLDGVVSGPASDATPFFGVVMEVGGEIRSGWRKGTVINQYIGPVGPVGGTFVYTPGTGTFVPGP